MRPSTVVCHRRFHVPPRSRSGIDRSGCSLLRGLLIALVIVPAVAVAQVEIRNCAGGDLEDRCSLAEMYGGGLFLYPERANFQINFSFAPPSNDGFATDLGTVEVIPLDDDLGPGVRIEAPPGTWSIDGDGSAFNTRLLQELRLLAGTSNSVIDIVELQYSVTTTTSFVPGGDDTCGTNIGGSGGFVDGSVSASAWLFGGQTRGLGTSYFSAPSSRATFRTVNGDYAAQTNGVIAFGGDLSSMRAIEIYNLAFAAGDCGTNTANSAEIESIELRFVSSGSAAQVFSAVLPASRSVQVDTTATAFATMINAGTEIAQDCRIAPGLALVADFLFQTTDPATNLITGSPNEPVDIAPGAAQSFLMAITPSEARVPTDVPFHFWCLNTASAARVPLLNSLLFSADNNPVPDVVALAATVTMNGIVELSPNGAFSVATVNVGNSSSITAKADTGAAELPVDLQICETDPVAGTCLAPPVDATTGVTTTIDGGATPTFAVFVFSSGAVPFDPAHNRVVVRFGDDGDATRGATSVAICTVCP